MADETDKEIKSRLNEIFPNQEVSSAVTKLVLSKRPIGWSNKSNSPYYAKKCGEQIKVVADRMLETGEPQIYRYDIWCKEGDPFAISKNTLYTRINQSIRYLVERMDPDGIYREWYDSVVVRRDPLKGGVIIENKQSLINREILPESILPSTHTAQWRKELDSWLESDDTDPFIKEHLALTPDEIKKLKQELTGLTNIMFDVTSFSVKVIKMLV